MCYDQGKLRTIKAKNNQAPLIAHKKHHQHKDKENQKLNYEQHKLRNHQKQQFTSTVQFQHKGNHNYVSVPAQPHHHGFQGKDRYAGERGHHGGYYVQNTKTLTFANVKHGGKKEGASHTEQSSFISIVNDQKKGHANKGNALLDKQRKSNLTERTEKPLIQRAQKKDNAPVHTNHTNHQNNPNPTKTQLLIKPSTTHNLTVNINPSNNMTLDDFKCLEELDFKPVQKKSIVPDKKYTAEKTTSKFDFSNKVKVEKQVDRKNEAKELKQFQSIEKMANMNNDGESLNLTCQLQQQYAVSCNYLEKYHKKLSVWNRAVLVDWMRHISYEYALLRDTYHIAVVILDNYLARTSNVPKSILQAIGATCLFIASKLQEFQCRSSVDFVESTNNSCSKKDIHQLQIKIVMTVRFKLNPPTLFSLANRMMHQWDIFIADLGKSHPLFLTHEKVHFKQLDENSYRMFRKMMQLIDCAVIDIETVSYKPKMLICSFMYLLLGEALGICDTQQILEELPYSSLYLINEIEEFNDLNDLFRQFAEHVFGFSLFDMLPTVQYCATFFGINFSFQKPMIEDENTLQSMSLEQYCSYQTYNSTMYKTVKYRKRAIY